MFNLWRRFTHNTKFTKHNNKRKTILKTFVNMILDTNRGWILDSSRNQTIDDFVNVPNYNKQKATNPSDYYSPGLFLKNTISGCKLFIARLGSNLGGGFRELNDQNEMIVNENHVINTYSSNQIQSTCGTIMSMIPPSDEFFSNSFDTNFLPAHATRIVGTYNWRSDTVNQGYNVTLETYLLNNYKYYFSVFVAEDCIGIGISSSLDAFPNYFVGKIIGSTCDNDNEFYSQYGVFMTKNSYSMTNSGTEPAEIYNTLNNAANQNGTMYLGIPLVPFSPQEYSALRMSSVFTADGNPTLGNTAYYSCYINSYQYYWLRSSYIFSNPNKISWHPIAIYIHSNNIEEYGITPGCGFKGYLDSDLFRSVSGGLPNGTILDDGFKILSYNLAVNWNANL